MNVLGIDPGGDTGYAIVNNGNVIRTGTLKYNKKKEIEFFNKVSSLYKEVLPDCVAIEQPFGGRFVNVVISLSRKVGIITIAIKNAFKDALVIETPPTEWKSKIGLKHMAKKEVIQAKIKEMFGTDYSEHEADAIGIALSVH